MPHSVHHRENDDPGSLVTIQNDIFLDIQLASTRNTPAGNAYARKRPYIANDARHLALQFPC